MTLRNFNATYKESGKWQDTHGESGSLGGSVVVTQAGDRLSFRYDDGQTQIAEPTAPGAHHALLHGESSTGMLYFGDNTVILEYVADVDGREESNTDTWTFLGDSIVRSGVIRQADRIIWFESEMSRERASSAT